MAKEVVNPEIYFQTQFSEELPIELQRTACGIASLYAGLKVLGLDDPGFGSFVADYVDQTSFNVPYVTTESTIQGRNVTIPVNYFPAGITEEGLNNASEVIVGLNGGKKTVTQNPGEEQFIPGFTYALGFDHRGIKPFIDRHELDLDAELIETDDLQKIFEKVKTGETIALLSVDHNKLGYPVADQIPRQSISTHVILIYGVEMVGETLVAQFLDPAYLTAHDGNQVRSLESLRGAYAGKGTVISKR